MSCYEWERGDIRLPRSEFSSFKKSLTEAYNSHMIRLNVIANAIYNNVLSDSKGKKNYNYNYQITQYIYDYPTVSYEDAYMISRSMLPLNKQGKPKKPKLKDFPKKTNRDNSYGDYITLDRETRTASWDVQENNRACESARNSHMGKVFFSLLSKIEWKNGSGGVIVGNDEYNRDADYEGGGANYTKNVFGSRDYWTRR